jgi:transglutaminase-like putative cysteine protease/tetratricopeptide (TPR) repeat protein
LIFFLGSIKTPSMTRRCFALLFLCICVVVPLRAQTAPAATLDTSQEAVVYERMDDLARFEDDGSALYETTAVIRAQSRAGVTALGQLVFGYSAATEELKIDYVRVRKPDGRVVETPPANAQDFALDVLRDAPTYSDYRERHVSVVNLQPGDVLEYHTVTDVRPLAPREFWYEHVFPKNLVVLEAQLQIDVPKSREVKLKSSPDHPYQTQENGGRRVYSWTIRNFMPDRKRDLERLREEEIDESDLQPDVQITTFTSWEKVAEWYAHLQGERVVVDDAIRKKAQELTQGVSTSAEKARHLYDYVARNIRYVSLSFGIGRLQPHAASEVLANGYGDCKDKSTLLEALLRAQGITSYPVLINSFRKLDPDVPSPAQFDHEITAVRFGASGSDLTWLDATAEVAPYALIMYQLRNKQALVASDDANSGLRRTSAEVPVKNLLTMKLDGKFTETGALDTTVELTAQGDSDLPLRAAFRRLSQSDWQRVLEYFSNAWGLNGDVSDIHMDSIEETGKPFHLTYHFHKENYFTVPTSGISFRLLPQAGRRPIRTGGRKKAAEPLDIGPAEEQVYRARIAFPPNFTVHIPEAVRMTRNFGDYSLTYTLKQNILEAERRIVLKVNELPATRRADYESFRTVTGNTAEQGLWCSITPASAAAVAAAAKAGGTPEQMRKAGASALERNDFTTAADLLKRALDQDASQRDGWDDLGRAYSGLHQPEPAIQAFRKQIELDPNHQRANSDLAEELQQQGKLEEAIAAYRKQTEITPSAKLPHKNLGLLLAQMQRDAEARTELETAAAIPPDDPEVKLALAQVYTRSGDKEKSEALMKSVMGASSMPAAGADFYAAALRDDADPNQALHDARQTLDNLGDQFDSGEYDHMVPSTFAAMNIVALAWAREGWAKYLQGQPLDAMQFLNCAWLLSQSGTVGNRLARALEKENQREPARHMFALAAAAGGSDAPASRQEVLKRAASAAAAEKEISDAAAELVQMRTVKFASVSATPASARLALVFDSSHKPERAEYLDGDASLRPVIDKVRELDFPVKFPDVSSVKIVRTATLTCGDGSGCKLVLAVPDSAGGAPQPAP